jgi:hypothetical protein
VDWCIKTVPSKMLVTKSTAPMNTTERVVRLDTLFFFKRSPPVSATDYRRIISHFPSFFYIDLGLFAKNCCELIYA